MKVNKNIDRPFGARDKVGYMLGDFGCNMSFQLISSYLMLFVTQAMGLSLAHWAVIVIIAKIFDAINDPIIGAIVDARRPGKHGKFKPWIFWGSFAIAITTTLLFIDIRAFSMWGKFAYVLGMYCVWSIAYTSANVPYGSLNAVLTDDPGQRASLSSLRSIGAGFAMLPIMVATPLIVYNDQNALIPERFVWVALICGIVGIAGFMATYFLTKERSIPDITRQKFNYKETLTNFFKNKAIVALCLASFAQLVFIMSYAVTMPLVYQLYFKNAKINSIASILVMIPMMIYIPFMSKLSVKHGKKEIATWPNLIGVVMLIIMLFIPFPRTTTGAWIYTGMLMVAMLGAGTFMLATWSMVADCVDAQEISSGKRDEASIYATYSLARKVAQGIGASLVALVLSSVGYVTNVNGSQDELVEINSAPEIATGILKTSIILPLIGFILVFFILLIGYNLNKKKVENNTAYLRIKHGEKLPTVTSLFYDGGVKETPIDMTPLKTLDEKVSTVRKISEEEFRSIVQDEIHKTIKK